MSRPGAKCSAICLFVFCVLLRPAFSQKLQLEIEPEWHGKPLVLGQPLGGRPGPALSFSRLDGLLSQLALQRADGSWLESEQWHVFLSAQKQRLSATADGLPAQDFKAIRFRVGLDPKTDTADPQNWPPEHPLHPDVCGLHWGWSSGYVFLAIEGHWSPVAATGGGSRKPGGELPPVASSLRDGFSYHLAGSEPPMFVELPVKFSGAQPTTIRLTLELAGILAHGEILVEATSTHSRAGDALAVRLKDRVARSFAVKSVQADLYQPKAFVQDSAAAAPVGTTPFRLPVSERLPKVKLPADNPLTVEGVELGRRLFHETRLSKNNSQSCASCHEQTKAFTDGRRLSPGESGQAGRRNAMALVNLAWGAEFFWDGRARSLREQVLIPIQDAHEMNETLERVVAKLAAEGDYPAQFQAAFGTAGITSERLARALEQFLLTLVSQESKFDRAARKLATLTPLEQRGLQLFVTEHDPARGLRGADCFHCHGGNLFSNHQFLNNGLAARGDDRGRMEVTGLESDRAKFKVPTLRNVALTAPYMHDGRFATLEEVVAHYNGRLERSPTLDPNLAKHPAAGLGLSAEDQAALVAFLKTLTDEPFTTSPAPVPPSSKAQ